MHPQRSQYSGMHHQKSTIMITYDHKTPSSQREVYLNSNNVLPRGVYVSLTKCTDVHFPALSGACRGLHAPAMRRLRAEMQGPRQAEPHRGPFWETPNVKHRQTHQETLHRSRTSERPLKTSFLRRHRDCRSQTEPLESLSNPNLDDPSKGTTDKRLCIPLGYGLILAKRGLGQPRSC